MKLVHALLEVGCGEGGEHQLVGAVDRSGEAALEIGVDLALDRGHARRRAAHRQLARVVERLLEQQLGCAAHG